MFSLDSLPTSRRAGNGDADVTPLIHQALQQEALLPKEHLVDTNYAEAKQFVQSQQLYCIDADFTYPC